MNWFNRVQWTRCAAGVILISTIAGCKRDEGAVYTVPKENSPSSQPAPMATPEMASPPAAAMSLPQLKYQLPEGWQEKPPAEMRVASFTALGTNGQSADVSVIPLGIVGKDLELVNMWRSQVQLPATSDPDAVKQAEPVAIGADQGRLFNFVSDQPMIGQSRQRILVAMLTRGSMSWFFKMTGEDTFVTSQKDNFIQFLKSVSFVENAPAETAVAPAAPATPDGNQNAGSIWTIPSGWQALPPSQFLLAEFAVTGTNGANADVNVAELGGEGGGLAANVNRWRGQLGLQPDTEMWQPPQIDVASGKASLIDLTGTDSKTGKPSRLVGVILPQNGQTWFYKLMGDPDVVAAQKDAFIKFIQSAKYPNAP